MLRYTVFNNTFAVVGTNESEPYGNALVDLDYQGIIVIPEEYNGLPILEIGHNAFATAQGITHVLIYAKITKINEGAFRDCPNLRTINIPNTVTFIDHHAIYSYNSSNPKDYGPNALGYLTISFEPNSQIKQISTSHDAAFGRMEHIIIKTDDDLSNVTCTSNIVRDYDTFEIISTKSFTMCEAFNSSKINDLELYHDIRVIESILKNIKQITCGSQVNYNHLSALAFIFLSSK